MRSAIFTIACDEWRYWRRSHLAKTVLIVSLVLMVASVWVTSVTVTSTAQQRDDMQSHAEHAFEDQPDRHPHRMIHYGHYLFRTPPPLASLDPGIDAFTGNAIFLEGHRQNSATLADRKQGSGLTWLSTLTPAVVMQVLAPILLITLGFSVMTREREAGTLEFMKVQGVSRLVLLSGKGVALIGAAVVVLLPLIAGVIASVINGAALLPAVTFVLSYLLYLMVWSAIVLFVSTISSSNTTSFSALTAVWILLCLILPRIASNTAEVLIQSPGKLETDFAVLKQLRQMGDGHNAAGPAFKALQDKLLAKYNVDSLDDLPVNFKGMVAKQSEADLTEVLNQFAEQHMQQQVSQAQTARVFGWVSPMIAIQNASMKLAGTDLENYHRFLREAETTRYAFVQSLNTMHAEQMTYSEDSNKYRSESDRQAATVSADNWKILTHFSFSPLSPAQRVENSSLALFQLLFVIGIVIFLLMLAGRRI